MDPHEWPDLNHRKRLDEARSRYSALASHSRDARDLQKAVSCHKFGWDIGAAWSSFGWNSISILGNQDFHIQLARIPDFFFMWASYLYGGCKSSKDEEGAWRHIKSVESAMTSSLMSIPLKNWCFCWRKSISACLRCLEALKGKYIHRKKEACQSEFCKDKSWPLTILLMVQTYWRSPVEVGSLSHYIFTTAFTTIPGGCLGFLKPSTVLWAMCRGWSPAPDRFWSTYYNELKAMDAVARPLVPQVMDWLGI